MGCAVVAESPRVLGGFCDLYTRIFLDVAYAYSPAFGNTLSGMISSWLITNSARRFN